MQISSKEIQFPGCSYLELLAISSRRISGQLQLPHIIKMDNGPLEGFILQQGSNGQVLHGGCGLSHPAHLEGALFIVHLLNDHDKKMS